MLSEGQRRRHRGTDVVIGSMARDGRAPIEQLAAGLESVAVNGALDPAAVLHRHPALVLIDQLAASSTLSVHMKRWEDVNDFLDAGIDVITTVNINQLESLRDVAANITGVRAEHTVPDAFVRTADQVELVDMAPEALRRRLAHGNIYPAEQVDAALAHFFRIGNLGALRELALSWLADQVEDSLDDYLDAHHIEAAWETRERVVVAITGAVGADMVIRRAARLARRGRGALIGVHVVPEDGFTSRAGDELSAHRSLLVELSGTYHEVVGDDIGAALVEFARTEKATQVVLGASRRSRWEHLRRVSVVQDVLRRAGSLDVHVIAGPDTMGRPMLVRLRRRSALSRRRVLSAWILVLLGLPSLTLGVLRFPAHVGLSAVLLIFLVLVMGTATIGGLAPGLAAAFGAFLLSNWFFVPPRHTLAISGPQNLVALVVFVAVGATVSTLVDRVAAGSRDALRARAEAEVLARTTITMIGEADPLDHLVDQLLTTFSVSGVALLSRVDQGWTVDASAGHHIPTSPTGGTSLALDPQGNHVLVLADAELSADDHRFLRTVAGQLWLAMETRRLQEAAARADALGETNALRTAMLQAVSHDLRTPLSSIKASATSLLSTEVVWTIQERHELLSMIDEEADRLNRLVGNLLDMSRLQAGAVRVSLALVSVEEIVDRALVSLGNTAGARPEEVVRPGEHRSAAAERSLGNTAGARQEEVVRPGEHRSAAAERSPRVTAGAPIVDIDECMPLINGDSALLERAVANVIGNALVWSPPDCPLRVEGRVVGSFVHLRIIDRGPGIPMAQREAVFEPFQRLGDRSNAAGAGLGLAIARGFTRATGGDVELDDTPGGGLTVTILLPVAPE